MSLRLKSQVMIKFKGLEAAATTNRFIPGENLLRPCFEVTDKLLYDLNNKIAPRSTTVRTGKESYNVKQTGQNLIKTMQ